MNLCSLYETLVKENIVLTLVDVLRKTFFKTTATGIMHLKREIRLKSNYRTGRIYSQGTE